MADVVRVWATADPFEGELMRGRLEADGVRVMLKGDGDGPYRAGPVYLFVPAEQEAQARAIVDAVGSGAFARDLDAAFDDPTMPDGAREGGRAPDARSDPRSRVSAWSTAAPCGPSSARTSGAPSHERRA